MRDLPPDMHPDKLLEIADLITRKRRERPERVDDPLAGLSPRQRRLYLQHQAREELRQGVDREGEAERVLLDRLRAIHGPQPEDPYHSREKRPGEYVRLTFPDYVNCGD